MLFYVIKPSKVIFQKQIFCLEIKLPEPTYVLAFKDTLLFISIKSYVTKTILAILNHGYITILHCLIKVFRIVLCCNRHRALLDRCLKKYTSLWNIWIFQLLCKKNYTTCVQFYTSCVIFLKQQVIGSVSQGWVNFFLNSGLSVW